MIRTIILLLSPLFINAQDSLFLNSESGTLFEDLPCQIGTQIKVSKAGTINALKFYKTESGITTYTLSVFNSAGVKIFATTYKNTATGWQRILVNIPIEAGTYTLSVSNPGRYSYKKIVFPRTRGNVTGAFGAFRYLETNQWTLNSTTYFVDAVISYQQTIPLSVSVSPDIKMEMPVDSVTVSGTVKGATSWEWEVIDSSGTHEVKYLNTLFPVIKPKNQKGGTLLLMLTGRNSTGQELSEIISVWFTPNPKIIRAYILEGDVIIWIEKPIFP